jgi:hypothetical protein
VDFKDCEILVKEGNRLFEQRRPVLSLWQEIAENFYPERADFTASRNIGREFADFNTTSYPAMVRRDLANIFSTMLRRQDAQWFRMRTRDMENVSEDALRWMESRTIAIRNALYAPISGFQRSMKQADDDVASFGQAVISCELNWEDRAYLWRTWHLRDVVWTENAYGKICRVDRKWNPTAAQVHKMFKGNVHEKVRKCLDKNPMQEIEVRHCFMEAKDYTINKDTRNRKYVSIFYDVQNRFIMEEVYTNTPFYAIPRWAIATGSQYAYSPSSMLMLPDARTLQAMTLTLLEAGQKAVDPPLIGVEDAIRGDVQAYPGGITSVDAEYDERMGAVLRPLITQSSNLGAGMQMAERLEASIYSGFFLNKVGLPPMGSGMSPMEVSQRVSEYVRSAMPLFEPLEGEYNGQVLELAFEVGKANGLLGPDKDIPDDLLGEDIEFEFFNPLRDAEDKAKGGMLAEANAVIAQMLPYDKQVPAILDVMAATRDVLNGIGAPRKWFRTQDELEEMQRQIAEEQQMQSLLSQINQGAQTAEQVGKAGMAIQGVQEGQLL